MELNTIIIALGIFLSPYLGYIWVYGFVLIKRLLAKELNQKKDLLKRYEAATPEQRMDVAAKGIVGKPSPTPPVTPSVEPPRGKGEWLDAPTPEVAARAENERVYREGTRRDKAPEGQWEKPKPEIPPPTVPPVTSKTTVTPPVPPPPVSRLP